MIADRSQIIYALIILTSIVIRTVFHRKAKRYRDGVELKESYLNMVGRAVVGLSTFSFPSPSGCSWG